MKVERVGDETVQIGGNTIALGARITALLELSDKVLILVNNSAWSETDSNFGRNILAYDTDGRRLWRIEDGQVMVGGRTVDKVSQGCTELSQSEDGTIHAWVLEWRHDLNPETGEISNAIYIR